jgi:flagellar hook-length control protein FliK
VASLPRCRSIFLNTFAKITKRELLPRTLRRPSRNVGVNHASCGPVWRRQPPGALCPATTADSCTDSCRARASFGNRINQPKLNYNGLFNANINGSPVADLVSTSRPKWARAADFVDAALLIDAALPAAPATQPKTAGGKPASQDQAVASFATMLESVTDASEDAATANAIAAAPIAPQATETAITVPTQLQFTGDTPEASTTGEVQPDGAPAIDPAIIGTIQPTELAQDAAAANPAGTNPAPAVTNPAPAVAAQTQIAATVAVATTAPTVGRTNTTTTVPPDETTKADGDDGVVILTNATAVPAATTSASPVLPATQTTGEASPDAAPLAQPILDTSAETQASAAPQADAKTQGQTVVAPSAASTQTTAQAQMKAQAAGIAIQATDAAQPAPATQAATTDVLATAATTTESARSQATPTVLQSAPAATLQVYTRMIERADGRAQRFEVRLDPAELGRVDVRIEIGADRKVHAVLAPHDSAALTDLMRGQRALERALSDAGIDLADNGVRFELAADNGRNGASQQRESDGGQSPTANVWRNFGVAAVPVSAETVAAATPAWRTQRLDLVA